MHRGCPVLVGSTLALVVALAAPAQAWEPTGTDWTWQAEAIETPFALRSQGWPSSAGSPSEVTAAIDAARSAWNSLGVDVQLNDGGTASAASWAMDETNVLSFQTGSFGGGTLAVAQFWSSAGQTYDCDIRFYSENDQGEISWSSDPSGAAWGRFDIQYVAEHELGHCMGLGHSADSDAVMYAYASSGAGPAERSLDEDDISGLRAIYGDVVCLDLDGDGWTAEEGCTNSGDCDDSSEWLSPGAVEVCDNGLDDNCDGLADPSADCPAEEPDPPAEDPDPPAEGPDEPGDGNSGEEDDPPAGTDDPEEPGDEEPPTPPAVDFDGDGWVAPEDCSPFDSEVHPGALEACDGTDSDCDGEVPADEEDADEDGFMTCKGDCDDFDPMTYPEAFELCDGLDNDCDQELSEVETDSDGDGQPPCLGDCEDGDVDVYAGAPELCDGQDSDCDGAVQDELDDEDGDGFTPCEGDCDDRFDTVGPTALEICDGLDNDCDHRIDEEQPDCEEESPPENPPDPENEDEDKDPELPWDPENPDQSFPDFDRDGPPWDQGCGGAEASLAAGDVPHSRGGLLALLLGLAGVAGRFRRRRVRGAG